MLGAYLRVFMHDWKVHAILLLVVFDILFGVAAAFKTGTFRLSYVADSLRNDGLKLFIYFMLYAGAIVAGGADIVIPGFDVGVIASGAWGLYTAALVGSILSSLRLLGVMAQLTPLNAPEKTEVVVTTPTTGPGFPNTR